MPKTLVTGANGFVAAHIIDQLIAAGHSVTGSLRSASKEKEILNTHPEWAKALSFVTVSDYAAEGTWDATFKGNDFDYVVHVAAPLLDDPRNTDFEKDFLRPSVEGNIQLLNSAKKYGKSLKSIAVTGSINAMTDGSDTATRVFDSAEWLPLTIEDAIKANHPYYSYCVSKAEAEKAIWKFVEEEKPEFTVQVLLPALIFGPPIQPVSSIKHINFSSDTFYGLFNGTNETIPDTMFPSYIDVRDLATAHVKSLTTPAVANKRFIVGGKPYSNEIAVEALKGVKELEGRLPKPVERTLNTIKFGDVTEWNEKLGLVIRSEEETFGDAARKILELEKKFAA